MRFTRRSLVASEETVETLKRLRSAGYRIGLIGDCARETPREWPSTDLAPLVDAAIFSCEVGMKKPDPHIYRLASQMLSVGPASCVFVGDGSSRELSGALAAGMRSVLVRIPLGDTYDAQRADVDGWKGASIETLRDVPSLLGLK